MKPTPIYTASRAKKDDTLYGPVHFSNDSNRTLCGQQVDYRWIIVNNRGTGEATCKKCLQVQHGEMK